MQFFSNARSSQESQYDRKSAIIASVVLAINSPSCTDRVMQEKEPLIIAPLMAALFRLAPMIRSCKTHYWIIWDGVCTTILAHAKYFMDLTDNQSNQLASRVTPSSCQKVPRRGSRESIGDSILGATGVDMNGVWNWAGPPLGGQTAGWLYLGSGWVKCFKPNFQNQAIWGGSLSIPFLGAFGLSVSQPGGYGLPVHFALKCESQGATLV